MPNFSWEWFNCSLVRKLKLSGTYFQLSLQCSAILCSCVQASIWVGTTSIWNYNASIYLSVFSELNLDFDHLILNSWTHCYLLQSIYLVVPLFFYKKFHNIIYFSFVSLILQHIFKFQHIQDWIELSSLQHYVNLFRDNLFMF